MSSLYDIPVTTLAGETTDLSAYRGKVLLIVNTASHCGFTPQYAGLEALYRQYKDKGFAVLGFPCNQFGAQEPGSEADIASFCEKNYGVSFPLFAKIEVNGTNAHPPFVKLKAEAPGILGTEGIKWNFTKFLLDQKGNIISRHAPTTSPEMLKEQIDSLLDTRS